MNEKKNFSEYKKAQSIEDHSKLYFTDDNLKDI